MHTIFSALLNFARAFLVPRARLAVENAALRQQLAMEPSERPWAEQVLPFGVAGHRHGGR